MRRLIYAFAFTSLLSGVAYAATPVDNGQPAECSVETAPKAIAFIKKHKKQVDMVGQAAHAFVAAMAELNPDIKPFHDIEKITFVEVNPEEHIFFAIMFGADVKGKPCLFGAVPMRFEDLNKVLEKVQEDKGGI